MCCPCCSGVNFEVKKGDQEIAHIEKMPLTCGECFKKTNRFEVDFKDISDAWEKRMVLASASALRRRTASRWTSRTSAMPGRSEWFWPRRCSWISSTLRRTRTTTRAANEVQVEKICPDG